MSTNAENMKTQAPKIVPESWSLALNKKLDASGVGMKIVTKAHENAVKDFGDTIHIGELGDVNISDYDESLTDSVTYQNIDAEDHILKLDQQKYFGIYLSDITQKQSQPKDLQSKFEKRAQVAIDLVKDTFILSSFADIPTENMKGSDAAPITLTKDNAYALFCWLAKTWENNNAVETSEHDQVAKDNQADGSMPYVVINPDVKAILLQAPQFIHPTDLGDKVLRKGSIGEIAGLDVLVSTNNKTVDGKAKIMAGINDAIAYAGSVSKVENLRHPKKFGDVVRGLYVYGKKTILPKALAGAVVDVAAADAGI